MILRALLAINPVGLRRRIAGLTGDNGIEVVMLPSGGNCFDALNSGDFDIVIFSRDFIQASVKEMIASVRSIPEQPEVLVMVDREDPEDRACLLAAGCMAVLNTSLDDDSLGKALKSLVERTREVALQRLQANRPEERYSFGDFLTASLSMSHFIEIARRVAQSETTVLVLGETGVGKERLARAIHAEGPRRSGPFVAVHCAALPEALLESELFGHEEGAFTGASRARKGYFELAHLGTIFLDEVGEMPLHLQVKLLRVLEDRIIHRVGSGKPTKVDVRLMAATNRDLEADMKAGKFRSDLYFRLAVVSLRLPPLRERREDIPMLVESYLEHFRVALNRPVDGIQTEAMEALVSYEWPGNVRELINVLEQTCLLSVSPRIRLEDLPQQITHRMMPPRIPGAGLFIDLFETQLDRPLLSARAEVVKEFEKAYLRRLLKETEGRIGEAADRAGLNERTLYDLLRRHGIRKADFKGAPTANRV
jgi:DNA-binding NtrC family response regulator